MSMEQVFIPFQIDENLGGALARIEGHQEVLLVLEISGNRLFDTNRPPVLFLGSQKPIDLAVPKAFSELLDRLDSQNDFTFSFDKNSITTVIWHGNSAEGFAQIGDIIHSDSLIARVYLDDLSISDIEMSKSKLLLLKTEIQKSFFK